MRTVLFIPILLIALIGHAQDNSGNDNSKNYKKRVLENTEIDILTSFYTQDGDNAAVTGGIGTEKLNDLASDISISIPLNDDDILKIDGTVSAYTSASSSNLNPFSGASSGGDDDDDDDEHYGNTAKGSNTGSPWVESSGASRKDTWINFNGSYSHSNDERDKIWNANVSFANEFDYTSFGLGGGYSQLFNDKNTELGIQGSAYLDHWRPQYPTEIKTYINNNGNLNADYFNGVDILDQNGAVVNKNRSNAWSPFNTSLVVNTKRNTYSMSFSLSQILSRKIQVSIFSDLVFQHGLLANPMQRVYFADKNNYYIGNAASIPNYTSPTNVDAFQLADDIERLPNTRMKLPVGGRFNFYINEYVVLRTYYRYYLDDWNLQAHTMNIEVPIKLSSKFTLYPSYRFYTQQAAKYFAPYEQHLSTSEFYTSDYDLSKFHSNQYGCGIKYTNVLTKAQIGRLKFKTVHLTYNYYSRNTGLKANIVTIGAKMIIE